MKKKSIQNLQLNKKSISNFNPVIGGRIPAEQTDIENCYTKRDESMCWE